MPGRRLTGNDIYEAQRLATIIGGMGTGTSHSPVSLSASAETIMAIGEGDEPQELTLNVQTANMVWAGPTTGAAAVPTFRQVNTADLTAASLMGIPALTFSTTNVEGTSASLLRKDATIALFSTANPCPLTPDNAAAPGTSGCASRLDHVHHVAGGVPSLTLGTTNVEGTSTSLLRTDATFDARHTVASTTALGTLHTVTGLTAGQVLIATGATTARFAALSASDIGADIGGTPGLTFGTTNTEGSSASYLRTDATIGLFSTQVPVDLGATTAAAAGTSGCAARRDHAHAVGSGAPTANLHQSSTNTEGSSASFARSDHSHAITSSANPGASASILATSAAGALTLTGLLTLTAGTTYNGATGTNVLTVPDNVAQAIHLVDVGGIEYLRVISTNTQPIVCFNDGGADMDFFVESDTLTDALVVRGSDGRITLGILTAGYVKSDASGVLSSDAIALADLPAGANYQYIGSGAGVAASWINVSTLAGVGLTHATGVLAVGMPTAVSISTANSVSGTTHTHAVTCSSGPGVSAAILSTGTTGELALTGILSLAEYLDHIGDTDTYWRFQTDNITIRAGGVDMIDVVEAATDYVNFPAGLAYINETANTFMTQGITLNQGANDNEIIALKSSDVAHGITDWTETDTYATMAKINANSGGLHLIGYKDADDAAYQVALALTGRLGLAADTTKSTAALGVVQIAAQVKSGTGVTAVGADGNLVVIANSTTARFIFDAEGSAHAEVEWTTFDEYDDVALLSDLETAMLAQHDPVKAQFTDFLQYNRADLERAGIVHFDDTPGHAMVNFTRLSMLLVGAIGQLAAQLPAGI